MRNNWRSRVKFKARTLFFLVGAAAFFCVGFCLWEQHLEPIRRFKVIVPGHLYQSGQPGASNLRRYIEKYQFSAILNLRTYNKKWEEQLAKDSGVRFIHLPTDAGDYVPEEWFDRLYKILSDASNYPLLVHCHAGRNRASLVAAFHRVKFQNWPLESAIDEMIEKGFDQEHYGKALQSLRNLCLRGRASARGDSEGVRTVIGPVSGGG